MGRVHAFVSVSKLQHICLQAHKDRADYRAQARETKDTPRMARTHFVVAGLFASYRPLRHWPLSGSFVLVAPSVEK